MALLRFVLLIGLLVSTLPAHTYVDDEPVQPKMKLTLEQDKYLCNSTDEFVKTLSYLRSTKEILLPENSARRIAEKVSRGCDGATERFKSILGLMKNVGISDFKALEMALGFAGVPAEVQMNFTEIFTRAFLEEFFDYDYARAVAVALELSKEYKGDPAQVRDDFIELARFCKSSKNLDLSTKTCGEYTLKLARLSHFYPEGVREPFFEFYKTLREDKDYGFDVRTALDVTYNVLKNGPRAADNFMNGHAFALESKGLNMGRAEALEFALKMAVRSYAGKSPPIYRAIANAPNP